MGKRSRADSGPADGHWVYIVRCVDGTLYTGYALDPQARERVHNNGHGARYTAGRLPVALVHVESFRSKSDALKREHELKRWPRRKKEALIGSMNLATTPR